MLYLFNKEIDLNTENSPLEKAINYTKKITLKYNQSNIAFDFVALSYTAPRANKYAYIMEGIDKEWTYTNTNQSASYAKLAPGKYVFKVKGSNNDGIWNEAGTQLEIEILPPWWQSGLAQVIYLILIISTVYYLLNRYRKRTEKRNAEKQRLFESEKEKELYSSKVEFFTNMAHEIRTPVTLINGPLESMLEMDIKDPEINKSLHVMKRSTSELLGLVNQLLDFRKVDSNKFLLNISRQNISGLLKDIYASFESSALRQNKTISLSMPDKDIYIPLDPGALSKILNNLFTNAIRYSENNIDVALTVEGQQIIIKFRNDGDIIPAELREKIFDPFFQVNKHRNNTSSSGIGLSLAKSLTELHTGKLLYQTQDNMNEFILELPLNEPDTVSEYIPEDNYIVEEDNEYQPNSNNAEIILVVEDNPEMLDFIAGKIQKKMHFAVETAHNGKEALQILEEKNIDIILSDVMMPEMDGFELCRNVKENIEYSHIPVVLLTARNDLESKIQGLEAGADAYVEKPFSMAHLNTQLTTLMNNRKREKEAFMRKPFLPVQNIGMNKADEQFIQKVIDIIHENITDSEFNVERLAEHVFMSRSSLHRKIKALTELTPIDFIRLIRLRKSAELIQNGDYRVGEVCYLVGINSPSYFIKLFQKQFGITPKEFINQK
jgi:signal transduction histidine kinase/DNA-binding response OmpR family regulator